MSVKKVTILLGLMFLLIVQTRGLWAADAPPAPLPPAARAAFDEGMTAVGQQQWSIAIRNFLKAQKAAPEAPEVLFNLGLAESKVPGRELRAMAWLQAYLLAMPAAANADAVRKEITSLKIRVDATLEKLISGTMQMTSQFSKVYQRENALQHLAIAQARAGDFEGAKQNARKSAGTTINTRNVNETLMNIAVKQYHVGDYTGAMDTIRTMETGNWDTRPRAGWPGGDQPSYPEWTSRAYRYIADLQTAAGEFSKAEATCGRADLYDQVEALKVLAWMEAIAGKNSEALAHAEKIVKLCADGRTLKKDRPDIGDIAQLQVLLGDIEAGKKTDALFPGQVKTAASLIKILAEAKDPKSSKENWLRGHFAYSSEQDRLTPITGEKWILSGRSKPTASIAIYLINNDLSSELFTDPQAALRAIAARPHRKTEFYEPERNEQFEGMEEAILQMADRLGDVMRLGR